MTPKLPPLFALLALLPGHLPGQAADALFQRLDRNGDGVLTRKEIPRLFDRLDRDQNGAVTPAEAARSRPGAPATPAEPPGSDAQSTVELKTSLDVRYATLPGVEARFHSLDIYAPPDAKAAPVLIFVHGGGWRGGDKGNRAAGENPARLYCAEGYLFVSINYRLTPAGRHPANIQDVAKAVAWTHDHIAGHGGDPARLSIMGHSAGAHLAALIAADERWLKAEGKPLSILQHAVLLDTAAYDIPRLMKEFTSGPGSAGRKSLYQNAFGDSEEAWRDASPRLQLRPGAAVPPMLLFYTGNRLATQILAPAFAAALTQAGAPSQAVDTTVLEHSQILAKAAERDHPLAQLVLRFLGGEAATQLPPKLDARTSAVTADHPMLCALHLPSGVGLSGPGTPTPGRCPGMAGVAGKPANSCYR